LLHGFPTSSWDWAEVDAILASKRPDVSTVALDWLGFGDSDKPSAHTYTIFEQANLLEQVWKQLGITKTALLTHDYGDTVTEELFARRQENKLSVEITSALITNGSIYGALNRPLFIQQILQWPVIGGIVTRFVSKDRFAQNFRRIFPAQRPIRDDELDAHWRAITTRNGNLIYHRLVHHYGDQRRHGERWERALETTDVPLRFLWGMFDPVSGAPIAERARQRIPKAEIVELKDGGHYPNVEVPDVVAQHAIEWLVTRNNGNVDRGR
jgi:pimeloyl-ACP methyl ester carboxylesterase